MELIYDLANDTHLLKNGRPRDKNWWVEYNNGEIEIKKFLGVISEVFLSGHNDFEEFEITDNLGNKTRWQRVSTESRTQGAYTKGKKIELHFVIDKATKEHRYSGETVTKILIES